MQRDLERALPRVPRGGASCSRARAPPRWPPTRCRRTCPTPSSSSSRAASGPTRATPRRTCASASRQALAALPGNAYEFTQPIQMRFNELIAGVRGDVAVKVFGDDFDALLPAARRGSPPCCAAFRGAADVRVEQIDGAPGADVDVDRAAHRPLRLHASPTCTTSSPIAVGGATAGQVFEGDRASTSSCACPKRCRQDLDALERPADAARRTRTAAARAGARRRRPPPRRRCASSRSARGDARARPKARTRSAARTASGGSSSRPTCAAATSARSSPRRRRGSRPRSRCRPGTWLEWGGQFENLLERQAAPRARGAALLPDRSCCCSTRPSARPPTRRIVFTRRAAGAHRRRRDACGCAACRSRSPPPSASSRSRASRC